MNTRTSTKTHNYIIVAIAIALLALGVALVLIFSPRNVASGPVGSTQNNVPLAGLELPIVHLEGNWTAKANETTFNATVVGNDIKIEMETIDGTSATYWHGTFKTTESAGNIVTSTKTEASDEIVISQSATKEFTVGQNSLTFKFSAMGFSKNVELRR